MKILIVSTYAESIPMAYRLKQEGHEVYFYAKDPDAEKVGQGLVERIDEWEPYVDQSDLIIFDDTGWAKQSESLKEEGYAVIGGNEYSDMLELDRDFGQQEMEDAGMSILPSEKFSNIDQAIKYVESNPSSYVIKPDGVAGNEKALTYVGEDESGFDVIAMLNHYKTRFAGKIKSLEIQKRIKGVEIAVSAFYNGTHFVEPIEVSFEYKKLCTGGLGPNTGEMGTAMWWDNKNCRLYKETIALMEKRLEGYHGYFDINCIATENEIYPLETTCRFGYPTIELKLETVIEDFGEFLYNLAHGSSNNLRVRDEYSICVVVAVPPFPYEEKKTFHKYSEDNLVIIKDPKKKGINPVEVYEEEGQWYITGESGYPLVVCGSGKSMQDAKMLAYSRVSNIIIPNMFYRIDVSDRWEVDYPRLKKWGWI